MGVPDYNTACIPFFLATSVAISIPFLIKLSVALFLNSSSERSVYLLFSDSITSLTFSILSESPATLPNAAPTALATYKRCQLHSTILNNCYRIIRRENHT